MVSDNANFEFNLAFAMDVLTFVVVAHAGGRHTGVVTVTISYEF